MSITLFTDGGAKPNPGPIGAGYYGEDADGMSHAWWKSVPGTNSNNDAEVLAALTAFQHAMAKGWKRVHLRPDSEYVIGLIERRDHYKKNGFKNSRGLALPNQEQAKALVTAVDLFVEQGGEFVIEWVKGHSGNKGNDLADLMATRGVIAASKGVEVEETITKTTKTFGKAKPADYNRLMSSTNLYFVAETQKTTTGHYVYYTGHHGKDDDGADKKGKVNTSFGKMLPEAVTCLVLLKEPDLVVESVIKAQLEQTPELRGNPFVVNLANLHRPATWEETKNYDGLYLHMRRSTYRYLSDASKVPVVVPHEPVKLGILMMERKHNRLDELVAYLQGDTSKFTGTDITSYILEDVEKQLKNKTVKETTVKLDLVVKGVVVIPLALKVGEEKVKAKVRLNIGHDLFNLNALQNLRKQNLKVTLMTWLDGIGMRYAVMYETDTGIAFREPMVSNLILFSKVK